MTQTITITNANAWLELRCISPGSIDYVVTDCPYEINFMLNDWDRSGIAYSPYFWSLVHRVLRSGGRVAAFGSARTYFLMAAAMKEAGLRVLTMKPWTYAENFPKGKNISEAFDKALGQTRTVVGYKRGVGGENLNDIVRGAPVRSTDEEGAKGIGAYGVGAKQHAVMVPVTAPSSPEAKAWVGWGTCLKTAYEMIIYAQKDDDATQSTCDPLG